MVQRSIQSPQVAQHPHFGEAYRESNLLPGGQRVCLFALGAQHGPLLARGFARLSRRSRYMRFTSLRPELSAAQLRYLTATDGVRHFALAAGVGTSAGYQEAGVGRFVQLSERPDTVEPAITVVDSFQRMGIGTLLIQRLLEAARERGYLHMQAEILSENGAMLGLLRKAGRPVALEGHGTVTIARMRLS